MDAALAAANPVIGASKFGAMPELESGHRFVVASNGLWLEAKTPWLNLCWPLATSADLMPMTIPFGRLEKRLEILGGSPIPLRLIAAFVADARAAMPNEAAGVFILGADGELRYEYCRPIVASAGFVRSVRPQLESGECVVVDIHSHGSLGAFFSLTDRADFGQETVVAMCVGRLDRPDPEFAVSVFCRGVEIVSRSPRFGTQGDGG